MKNKTGSAGRCGNPGNAPVYLVWLEWPEECFRVDDASLAYLKSLVPPGAEIIRARTRDVFLDSLARATHVITWYFESGWFALSPNLELLATPSAGKELLPQTAPAGVKVHFGGFHGEIIAESVVGFMLAWCRGFFAAGEYRAGRESLPPRAWLSSRCRTLSHSKAVIAGYGRIGKAIARMLEGFSCDVRGFTRKNVDGLPAAVEDCDWFIMALPSTTGTDDFLDSSLLGKMPEKCVVINVGRGNSIDETALLSALKEGRIAGAYLDVAKTEPLESFKTLVGMDRKDMPENLILMPHAAAFSPRYMDLCFRELKDEGLI